MGGGEKELKRERLADYAHAAWSGWMKYLFKKSTLNHDGTVTIPKWAVERWTQQSNTKYIELPENEKESDRKEADMMLAIIKSVDGLVVSDMEKIKQYANMIIDMIKEKQGK